MSNLEETQSNIDTTEVKAEVSKDKKVKRKKSISAYKPLRLIDKIKSERCYEVTFLLRNDISYQDAMSIVKDLFSKISEMGGSVKKCEYWGLRNLRYKIKKSKRAHFYCLHFTGGSAELNTEIERIFRINSSFLRGIVIAIQFIPDSKSPMILDLEDDIKDGIVVYNEKYIVGIDD